MGNASTLCFPHQKLKLSSSSSSIVKLAFWEGNIETLKGKRLAGEIMFQYPDKMICNSNSFFIGQNIPTLSIGDELIPGETYFVLPIDRFAYKMLTINSLSLFASSPASSSSSSTSSKNNTSTPINFCEFPFQYVKGEDGRMLIRVLPQLILKLITSKTRITTNSSSSSSPSDSSFLCSTPELKKHYDLLVGSSKEKIWSPKLETITESKKARLSPCRLLSGFGKRSSMNHRFMIKGT